LRVQGAVMIEVGVHLAKRSGKSLVRIDVNEIVNQSDERRSSREKRGVSLRLVGAAVHHENAQRVGITERGANHFEDVFGKEERSTVPLVIAEQHGKPSVDIDGSVGPDHQRDGFSLALGGFQRYSDVAQRHGPLGVAHLGHTTSLWRLETSRQYAGI